MIKSLSICLQLSFINIYYIFQSPCKGNYTLLQIIDTFVSPVRWVSRSCTNHLFPTHVSQLLFPVAGCILSSLLHVAVFQATAFPSSSSFVSSLNSIFPQASSCPESPTFGPRLAPIHLLLGLMVGFAHQQQSQNPLRALILLTDTAQFGILAASVSKWKRPQINFTCPVMEQVACLMFWQVSVLQVLLHYWKHYGSKNSHVRHQAQPASDEVC